MARYFAPEFKAQIVAIYRQGGRTFSDIAREYNISPTSVATWCEPTTSTAARPWRPRGMTNARSPSCVASWRARRRSSRSWKSRRLLRAQARPVEVYAFIAAEKARAVRFGGRWSIATACRVLEVSRAGYYDWLRRGSEPLRGRAAANAALLQQIRIVHDRRRHHHCKHDAGWQVSRDANGVTWWISPTKRRYAKPRDESPAADP